MVDTPDARHEAGDLLQAGLDVARFADLRAIVADAARAAPGPVLFKSCGWAGWDLAAARCALPASWSADPAPGPAPESPLSSES